MDTFENVVLAVHGGAGRDIYRADHPAEREAACRAVLEQALRAGHALVQSGGSAVDAVEAAVRVLEDDPLYNAGRGASYAFDGSVELDSSVMDGSKGLAGAISGVRIVKNPVTLARTVMEQSPYVLLSGIGAEEFAREIGLPLVENDYFKTPGRTAQWKAILAQGGTGPVNTAALPSPADSPDGKLGTVGAVARDRTGSLAAATSTGGMAGKRYGRIGDSPLIGAGTWAEDATCAVSATGHGEFFIRAAVAHDIAARIAYGGQSLPDAARAVILEKLAMQGGDGGIIALNAAGIAVLPYNTPAMYRGCITESGDVYTAIF